MMRSYGGSHPPSGRVRARLILDDWYEQDLFPTCPSPSVHLFSSTQQQYTHVKPAIEATYVKYKVALNLSLWVRFWPANIL